MTTPLLMLAPGPAPAPAPVSGRVGQATSTALNADDSSLALPFGDLLAAMAVEPAPVEPLEQGSDTPADILTLLSADDLGTEGVAEDTPVSGLWVLLAEAGRPDVEMAVTKEGVADVPPRVAGLVEPRPSTAPLVAPGALVAGAAVAVDVPEALQGLVAAAGQPAATEAAGGNALAGALQAPVSERLDAASTRPTMPLPLPPQEARAAFTQTLDQVVWMTREGVHQARLQLEPAHLGRVDIWLDIDGGEAKLHLGAQQAQVREALESVLPRLRDALAQHGMSLMDASVSSSGREQPEYSQRNESDTLAATVGDETGAAEGIELRLDTLRPAGLLDLYA